MKQDETVESEEKTDSKDNMAEESSESEALIPEDFQKQAMDIVKCCTNKAQVSYLRDCVYRREEEIRKEEHEKEMKSQKKTKKPNAVVEFTDTDMPSIAGY